MKNLIFFLLIHLPAFVYAQGMDEKIKNLANEIADQVVKNGSKKVAVTTLDYKGCNTEFGKFLAEELTGNLSTSGRAITVVNQKMLEALLAQNQLTAKGLLETNNKAAKLGEVSGIDALVYGTITTLGEDIRVSVSIVKLPTLGVLGYAKSSFSLTAGIKEMLPCLTTEVAPITNGIPPLPNSKNKKCAINHTGTYCFQNATQADIKVHIFSTDFIIHPGQTECNDGMDASASGERTYKVKIYRDAKKTSGLNYETHQVVVSECQVKTYIVR